MTFLLDAAFQRQGRLQETAWETLMACDVKGYLSIGITTKLYFTFTKKRDG